MTNRSAICHFLLVSHCNRTSISNPFRDIRPPKPVRAHTHIETHTDTRRKWFYILSHVMVSCNVLHWTDKNLYSLQRADVTQACVWQLQLRRTPVTCRSVVRPESSVDIIQLHGGAVRYFYTLLLLLLFDINKSLQPIWNAVEHVHLLLAGTRSLRSETEWAQPRPTQTVVGRDTAQSLCP